jgi:hypothetical protein
MHRANRIDAPFPEGGRAFGARLSRPRYGVRRQRFCDLHEARTTLQLSPGPAAASFRRPDERGSRTTLLPFVARRPIHPLPCRLPGSMRMML